jgi:phage terminase large subunit-like protein
MPTFPEILLGVDSAGRETLVRSLPDERVLWLNQAFGEWAHDGQVAPAGDWRTWVLMAGRGFGKTRAGAEWVLSLVRLGMSGAVRGGAAGPRRPALGGPPPPEGG